MSDEPRCGGVSTAMRNHPDRQPCDREAGHEGVHRHHVAGQLVHEWGAGGCVAGTVREPDPDLFSEFA